MHEKYSFTFTEFSNYLKDHHVNGFVIKNHKYQWTDEDTDPLIFDEAVVSFAPHRIYFRKMGKYVIFKGVRRINVEVIDGNRIEIDIESEGNY